MNSTSVPPCDHGKLTTAAGPTVLPVAAPVPGASVDHLGTSGIWRPLLARVWPAVAAVLGAALGVLPHLMHHVTLFAGALVITGAGGNLLLGAIGLVMSVPLLRRLHRRTGSWWAPALATGAFAAMFTVSTLVIGPALAGSEAGTGVAPAPATPAAPSTSPSDRGAEADHAAHHDG